MAETTETSTGLPRRLRRVAHLAQRRIGDETVVLDLRGSRVYGVNLAGGELLERLRSGAEAAELRRWARAGGDADDETGRFLADMLARGLVVADEGEAETDGLAAPVWAAPRLLWHEDVARVTHQISPPQQITNPQCQP